MNLLSKNIDLDILPRLGTIDVNRLWENIPLDSVAYGIEGLRHYEHRHDEWTEKIRIIGLDGGVLVDYRLLPGLDRLFEFLYNQAGWARPEVFVVSDIGRKGIDSWSAISVVSDKRPIILLGTSLVESLNEVELAFVIGHETGHLLCYTSQWRSDMSLGFLIREMVDTNQEEQLNSMFGNYNWRDLYTKVMRNCRNMETRCDRLGLLLCGDWQKAASALLAVALKSAVLARSIDLEKYLTIQYPLLATAPEAGPMSVNAGHPFVPYRIHAMLDFINSGGYAESIRLNAR